MIEEANRMIKDQPSRITVLAVSWFSTEFISSLYDNLLGKAARPDTVDFLVIDNTNGEDIKIAEWAAERSGVHLKPLNAGLLRGSEGHGHGLNHGIKSLASPYGLVIDPDVYVFKDHWDDFFIRRLEQEQAVAIGAPYPFWRLGNYHDFPSPAFLFFDTAKLKKYDTDWTPFPLTRFGRFWRFFPRQVVRLGLICTRKNLVNHLWLRWIGQTLEHVFGVCDPDTGWLLAASVRNSGERVILLREAVEHDRMIIKYGDDSPIRDIAREYELYLHQGEPVVAHKYSTYSLHFRTRYGNDPVYWWDRVKKADMMLNRGD